ncbi:MAG: hypothetical protein Udaeo2_13980 [Candidatus Udaeobacter sp.]|nr:MAG: hypothetical protein Udaeo2_13980 [Candidatus Udaeobacter sp.]
MRKATRLVRTTVCLTDWRLAIPALKKTWPSFKMTKEDFVQLPGGAAVVSRIRRSKRSPVVFCHGWPSSCTMARLTDEPARELGVRIISPDRPGISGRVCSQSKIGRLAARCRTTSGTSVLASFGCLQFRRAPYAYATATAMPNRVGQLRSSAARFPWPNSKMPGVAATLPLDAGASSIATATLAKVVLYGAADSCIAAACPPSTVTFEDVDVATMRC